MGTDEDRNLAEKNNTGEIFRNLEQCDDYLKNMRAPCKLLATHLNMAKLNNCTMLRNFWNIIGKQKQQTNFLHW